MKVWRQEDWADSLSASEPTEEPIRADGSEEAKKAREKAVYYLQFSGKTEYELRKKLAEQEFSPASVDSAIEFVKKYRYLDDEDYARRFVERNGNKKSRKQMVYELTQKGVARDILEIVLEDMEVDEEAQSYWRRKTIPEKMQPGKKNRKFPHILPEKVSLTRPFLLL